MKLSIIIPTLNEAETIEQLLGFLKINTDPNSIEIIVVDGGSTDKTVALAKDFGVTIINSSKASRALQMNEGAATATGDVLYFVHADSFPPKSFFKDIRRVTENGYQAGRYRTKFNSTKRLLSLNAFFTRFDWLVCYGGDQTFFITHEFFKKINGYNPDLLIMEDYDITARAKQQGNYFIIPKDAVVSIRKYKVNSWLSVQMANYAIIKMYKKGASQLDMLNKYQQLIRKR